MDRLPEIALKNADKWWAYTEKNQHDPYGAAILEFAERWAQLMQQRIGEGKAVAEIADQCSTLADTDGITGFMYGCAVQCLSECWEHGEELRRWHNLETQIGDEGERANETGGVLNPALLTIKSKD